MGNKMVEGLSKMTTSAKEISQNLLIMDFTIVTACLIDNPNNREEWVLVDTGLENSGEFIIECAEKRYGKNSTPKAIILTHGHFDHVGSVIKLSRHWNVPVYIHELEIPYVTGQKDYPLADSTVDEGMVAKMSPGFPHTAIDISSKVSPLPKDGSVPGIPGWKWIHTPGHTEGHVSLFDEKSGILIAGDAFASTKQESLSSVTMQREEISGPPKYLTTDWKAAKESIIRIKDLKPSLALLSHGQPMGGDDLTKHLEMLVEDFDEIAKPEQGIFV